MDEDTLLNKIEELLRVDGEIDSVAKSGEMLVVEADGKTFELTCMQQ